MVAAILCRILTICLDTDMEPFSHWLENMSLPPGISSEQAHILRELGKARGPLNATTLRKNLPGLGSVRLGYITITMPANELIRAGLVTKVGHHATPGVGWSYVGPGSARPDKVEKDDPAGEVYALTDAGHELVSKWLGQDTRPAAKIEEPEEPYTADDEYNSKLAYYTSMINLYEKELRDAENRKKPRLAAEARKKRDKWQKLLNSLIKP